MNEFADRIDFLIGGDFFFEIIFDGLDIVVGGALNILDALRIVFAEIVQNILQKGVGFV